MGCQATGKQAAAFYHSVRAHTGRSPRGIDRVAGLFADGDRVPVATEILGNYAIAKYDKNRSYEKFNRFVRSKMTVDFPVHFTEIWLMVVKFIKPFFPSKSHR